MAGINNHNTIEDHVFTIRLLDEKDIKRMQLLKFDSNLYITTTLVSSVSKMRSCLTSLHEMLVSFLTIVIFGTVFYHGLVYHTENSKELNTFQAICGSVWQMVLSNPFSIAVVLVFCVAGTAPIILQIFCVCMIFSSYGLDVYVYAVLDLIRQLIFN